MRDGRELRGMVKSWGLLYLGNWSHNYISVERGGGDLGQADFIIYGSKRFDMQLYNG